MWDNSPCGDATLAAMTPVKRLPANRHGRDFVTGDLHGCYQALISALKHQSFDPSQDRLLSVGDLVDRGPDSAKVLKLTAKPWFHAVMGNHEWMALTALQQGQPQVGFWLANDGHWWTKINEFEQQQLFSLLQQLPLALEVPFPDTGMLEVTFSEDEEEKEGSATTPNSCQNACLGMIHAEVPNRDWSGIHHWSEEQRYHALWSRALLRSRRLDPVAGIAAVAHGHTIVEAPCWLGNRLYVDTGACLSGKVTLTLLSEIASVVNAR